MKTPEEIKAFIADRIKEKNLSLNEVSLAIGKNGTYLFQFINRASPKRLGEVERKKLARILELDEQELTDLPIMAPVFASNKLPDIIKIDMLDVVACCGNGLENYTENVIGQWSMPVTDFKQITLAMPENIKLISIKGDSMQPTIKEGDWAFIDISKRSPDSDGMFLLRIATGLAVKRIQGGLSDNLIIKSDNPKYDNLTAAVGEVSILGKVIYILKAERVG